MLHPLVRVDISTCRRRKARHLSHLHLWILYLGATILVFPGMKVSSIQMPSGGVIRFPPVSADGSRRMVSLMKAFRCGRPARAFGSVSSIAESSA